MNLKIFKFEHIILLAFFLTIILSCKKEIDSKPLAKFVNRIDFGKIKYGQKIIKSYTIENISISNIVIHDIKSSCGCTVPKINDSLILPNTAKKINVEYSPKINDIGKVKQSIVIKANTNPSFLVLYLEGEVIK